MKLVIILLSLLFCVGILPAQTCDIGSLVLSSQAEVDAFSIDYPDCTILEGTIKIIGDDITNLDAFSNYTEIDGFLQIWQNPILNDVSGLTYISGNLDFSNNLLLDNLSGLENLRSIGGYLRIYGNAALVNLIGLEGLNYVAGITIEANNSLQNLSGLGSLITVYGPLTVRDNEQLVNLIGLESLTSLPYFSITRNDNLVNLAGLESLTEITNTFQTSHISYNPNLLSLSGLNALSTVAKGLRIIDNDLLESLSGLESLSLIGEDLYISSNAVLTSLDGLELLTSIGRNFEIKYLPLLANISSLANLSTVGGNLIIDETGLSSLNGLENLTSIANEFILSDNENLTSITSLAGVTFGTKIEIVNAPILQNLEGLEGLTTIDELVIARTEIEDLNPLSSLSTVEHLSISENNSLLDLSGLTSLSFIDYYFSLRRNDNLVNFGGLENLVSIASLDLQYNDKLENFIGLENVNSIGSIYTLHNPELNSFLGLESIETIGSLRCLHTGITSFQGLESIETLNNFYVDDCPQLNSFQGLESLRTVNVFEVRDNDNLVSFTGLSSLRSVVTPPSSGLTTGGRFWVISNPNLTDLSGLVALDTIEKSILIRDNWNLNECNISAICNAILNTAVYKAIEDNNDGCNSEEEIIEYCGIDNYTLISFYDANGNGVQDVDEQLLNLSYSISPQAAIVVEADLEDIFYILPDIEYTLTWNTDANWSPTTATTYTFMQDDVIGETIAIGYLPNGVFHEVLPDISSGNLRCNEQVNFWIDYSNNGTIEVDGTIELNIDPLASFVSADPAPTSINGNEFTWSYEDLLPTHIGQIQVVLQMPNQQFIGEFLTFNALSTAYDESGAQVYQEGSGYRAEVRCAYDPNDKQVSPDREGDENYTLHEEILTYTIRFQNTGNDVANKVVIRDALDENLDWSTFRPISSSHTMVSEITDKGDVKFIFDDIFLPDSTSNYLGSQGFVKFQIKAKEGLPEFTEINNEARIYFDYNPPIITNTTTTTLVDNLCFTVDDSEAIVYGSDVVLINWERPFSGKVYRIRYREIGGTWNYVDDIQDTESFVTELEANTTYQYQLRSLCEELGTATWTVSKTFTTLDGVCDFPNPVAEVISGNVVKLDWKGIEGANKYRIKYKPLGGTWTEVQSQTFARFLNDLTPNTSYEYKIKTVCDSEASIWSPSFYFTTSGTICDRPITVTAFGNTSTTAIIYWGQQNEATKFKVKWVTNSNAQTVTISNNNTSSVQIANLTPNTEYKVLVKTKCPETWTNYTVPIYFTTPSAFDEDIQTRKIIADTDFNVYPNPTSDILTIEWGSNELASIEIYNTLHQRVKTIPHFSSGQLLNVASFENGTYTMKIMVGEQTIQKRFVKMK